jgi:hypothetical protein
LTLRRGGWSIDWWIGAEDRWHLPSREAAVRQTLIDGTPVVETSMRVPGGDAVICHYVWESPSGPQVVIEVDNRSPSPFAVALAVRPTNVEGPSPVHRLEWRDRSLWVDGGVALVLATSAQDVVLCDRAGGDALDVLMARTNPVASGLLPVSSVAAVDDPTGGATAAVVVPVAHRTLMRALVPLGAATSRTGAPSAATVRLGTAAGSRRRLTPPQGAAPVSGGTPLETERFSAASLPAPAVIAAGWTRQTDHRLRIEWPAGRIGDAVTAQRHSLLLTELGSASRPGVEDAEVVMALVTSGASTEANHRLAGWVERTSARGELGIDPTSTAAVLCALDLHHAVARTVIADSATVAAAAEAVARASASRRSSPRRSRSGRSPSGLPPSVSQPWAVAGLIAASRLLDALGEDRAAATAREWVRARLPVLSASVDPHERVLAADLGLLDPSAALDAVREMPTVHPAVALIALRVGLRSGSEQTRGELDRFLASASSTWTWPDVIDPRTSAGVAGDGHSPAVVAGVWQLARDLLVRDQPPSRSATSQRSRFSLSGSRPQGTAGPDVVRSISICTWLPDDWLGRELEVHGLPTRYGRLSYALRWHGTRPALLWEMADASPGMDLRLRAPGLDPSWTGDGLRGDALLALKVDRAGEKRL